MSKVLFISRDFHPSNCANAKRPFFLAKEFVEKGWHVDVMASTRGMGSGKGETFVHPKRLNVERLPDWGGTLSDGLCRRNGRVGKWAAAFVRGVLWPDVSVFWVIWLAVHLRGRRYDRVVVFIHPVSLLLLSKLVPAVSGCWVYDYLDPVSPQRKKHPRKSPIPRLLAPLMSTLEKEALTRASLAVFTSESSRKAYLDAGLVSAHKTVYISQFFDESLYDPSLRWDGRVLSIVYAGSFDRSGCRSPGVFLRSLASFLERCPEAKEKIRFEFYGRWWPEHNQLLSELDLEAFVFIHEALPYEDYLKVLQQSAVLLLVTAPEHNLFIPGKLLDCLGAQRPILAFTPLDSETAETLRAAEKTEWLCAVDSVSEGALTIEKLFMRYGEGRLGRDESSVVGEWSSRILMEKFEHCVRSLSTGDLMGTDSNSER